MRLIYILLFGFVFATDGYGQDKIVESRKADKYINRHFVKVKNELNEEVSFVSKNLVTNLEYHIFLLNLNNVFGDDQPYMLVNNLPDSTINPNFWDQDFWFHPITGVNFLQAMNYCNWRSDNFNQESLIREHILKWNGEQRNEDVFTSDTHLFGLYIGATGKVSYGWDGKNWENYNPYLSLDYFVSCFRLPTLFELEKLNDVQPIRQKYDQFGMSRFVYKKRGKVEWPNEHIEYLKLKPFLRKKDYQNLPQELTLNVELSNYKPQTVIDHYVNLFLNREQDPIAKVDSLKKGVFELLAYDVPIKKDGLMNFRIVSKVEPQSVYYPIPLEIDCTVNCGPEFFTPEYHHIYDSTNDETVKQQTSLPIEKTGFRYAFTWYSNQKMATDCKPSAKHIL